MVLDVGGEKFSIEKNILQRYPKSRFACLMSAPNVEEVLKLCDEFTPANPSEYFFDRNPDRFPVILNMYRIKELHMMKNGCSLVFQKELEYWMIDEDDMEPCCSMKYYEEVVACQTEKEEVNENAERVKEEAAEGNFGSSKLGKLRSFIWCTLENPGSAPLAKVWAVVSMLLVLLSTVLFFLETVEGIGTSDSETEDYPEIVLAFDWAETIIMIVFTIEYVLRLATCPRKLKFVLQPLNIIDLLALIPFYLAMIVMQLETLKVIGKAGKMIRLIRIMRLMRLFKLARHIDGIQSLFYVMKRAQSELGLLQIIVLITILTFASLVYVAENARMNENYNCTGWAENLSKEDKYVHPCYIWTFFESCWWSLMNLTTVGYAIAPQTFVGKLVAGICTVCGVFIIKFPIPIIVNNFSALYNNRMWRNQLLARKKEAINLNKAEKVKKAEKVNDKK